MWKNPNEGDTYMAFERPITIKEAINNVHRKKYLLPAIQREFVWDEEQIK